MTDDDERRDRLFDILIAFVTVSLAIGAVLMTPGCATLGVRGHTVDHPRAAEAVAFVWHAYGRTDAPPRVLWVEGGDLNCTDSVSGDPGFVTPLGCRGGYTLTPLEVSVAWLGPDRPYSTLALAHELLHAAQGRRGIADPAHRRPEWQDPATCPEPLDPACGLLAEVMEALSEAGM